MEVETEGTEDFLFFVSVSAFVASVRRENKIERRRKAAFFAQPIKVLVPGSGQNWCKTKMAADNTVGQVRVD